MLSYFPIRVCTLRPEVAVLFDLYILVGDKYVHYMRQQDLFEANRLKKLKEKGVKKLYIKPGEENLYLQYLDAGLGRLSDQNLSMEDKGAIASDSLTTEAENVETSLETEAGFESTQSRVQKVIQFLSSDTGALKGLIESSDVSEDIYKHSSNVAALSLSLAMSCGLSDPKELLELAIACLVHDIGKAKLGLSSVSPFQELTPDQAKNYRRHPAVASEFLASKRFISPKVLRLVNDHEEVGEGEGYPEKKQLRKLPLNSQIMNLCNIFDQFATSKKLKPSLEAAKLFFQEKADLFDLDHINKLSTALAGK